MGGRGPIVYIDVPPGTLVRDRERGFLIRDLKEAGDQMVIARGGRGRAWEYAFQVEHEPGAQEGGAGGALAKSARSCWS